MPPDEQGTHSLSDPHAHSKLRAFEHEREAFSAQLGGMTEVDEYPGIAAKLRREAENPEQIHLRDEKLRAAARWESVADEAENPTGNDRNFSSHRR